MADAAEEAAGGSGRGPIAQLAATEELAVPGEAVVSAEVAALLAGAVTLEPLPGGAACIARAGGDGGADADDAGLPGSEPGQGRLELELKCLSELPQEARVQAYQVSP